MYAYIHILKLYQSTHTIINKEIIKYILNDNTKIKNVKTILKILNISNKTLVYIKNKITKKLEEETLNTNELNKIQNIITKKYIKREQYLNYSKYTYKDRCDYYYKNIEEIKNLSPYQEILNVRINNKLHKKISNIQQLLEKSHIKTHSISFSILNNNTI